MHTKLTRFAEGVMEAAWLAALLLTPVFFNVFSGRIFEPDKIAVMRSLALLILAAWIVKLISAGGIRWEKEEPGHAGWKRFLRIPMAAPVVALAIVYIISTVFSVTPRISLWGSYQRLQGTYTTLSYIVFFAAIAGNLRRRAQVERIITTVIISSLPVSLYGILQRFRIDPIPWGGDVTTRVASNMGNSIFVAAYLIMAFPLTLGRIIQAFTGILKDPTRSGIWLNMIRGVFYIFIAAFQLTTQFLSGSRGPLLGLLVGLFFLLLVLTIIWRSRAAFFSVVGLASVVGAFLLLLNIPGGPLESLRSVPALSRYSQLLNPDSNNAKVRLYIWRGASELVGFHDPINFPDGTTDRYNFIRPLIGYGPESMYVAYNQFYPPELGHVEKRNASPDRSHNETWDSLVITGGLGLVVYLGVFLSVFYYGLKWIGLIESPNQRNIFLAACLAGGVIGAIGVSLWREPAYFGVGLPFGIAAGMLLYVIYYVLVQPKRDPLSPGEMTRILTLSVLLAAVLAHFIEINFGIAIVSTRTHFWVYAGLLIAVGYILPRHGEYLERNSSAEMEQVREAAQVHDKVETRAGKSRRKKVEPARRVTTSVPQWIADTVIGIFIVSLLLMTIGYAYITNSRHYTHAFDIIASSFTRLPNRGDALSYGVLALVLTTWLVASILWSVETSLTGSHKNFWKKLGLILAGSFFTSFFFLFWHGAQMAALEGQTPDSVQELLAQVDQVGGMLTTFYISVFLILIGSAFFLKAEQTSRKGGESLMAVAAGVVLLLIVFTLTNVTNLRIIHADVAFKIAEPFNRSTQWPVATLIYKHANNLAPDEDHYYLFLGRSYLEQAKEAEDASLVTELVKEAESDLKVAQKINPLNTDHTANLGRLYSWWASRAEDVDERLERGQISSDYYATALKLSPQNSTLWGEWALVLYDVLGQPQESYEKILHAISLDEGYTFTQGLAGDYWSRQARAADDPDEKKEAFEKAREYYLKAAAVAKSTEKTYKTTYLIGLGNVSIELGDLDGAISAFEQAVKNAAGNSDVWRIEETIARLYLQTGDVLSAETHAQAALSGAPDDQSARLQELITQIKTGSQ